MNTTLMLRSFADRRDAGRQLAGPLAKYAASDEMVILALPRGGVPVAAEVARSLGTPFDVLIVRKLGVPGQEELALGAIASGGVQVLSKDLISRLGLNQQQINAILQRETTELERREKFYRNGWAKPVIKGRTVIVVDDGIATGATMSAAIELLRRRKARRIIVAAPVVPADTASRLRGEAAEVITLQEPENFSSVGQWYDDFSQTCDNEVRELLAEAHPLHAPRDW